MLYFKETRRKISALNERMLETKPDGTAFAGDLFHAGADDLEDLNEVVRKNLQHFLERDWIGADFGDAQRKVDALHLRTVPSQKTFRETVRELTIPDPESYCSEATALLGRPVRTETLADLSGAAGLTVRYLPVIEDVRFIRFPQTALMLIRGRYG